MVLVDSDRGDENYNSNWKVTKGKDGEIEWKVAETKFLTCKAFILIVVEERRKELKLMDLPSALEQKSSLSLEEKHYWLNRTY
jgi:hypothetical protein